MYVKGTTRVKGVSNKNVYYVGCVESDGYIYFNDSVSYRIPTPATLTEATNININDVQIWYTIRNCWIRANYFTSLKVYGVDFEHMYERIGTLESKVATLESKVATLESKVATLESKVATLESKVATLETKVAQLETDVADLQVRMTAAEAGITSLQNRMNTAEQNINALQLRMSSAEQNIITNRNNITAINNVLGYLPNLIGQNTTLEDWLRAKFQSVDGSITTLNTNVTNLTTRVTRIEGRLDNAYSGSGGGSVDMEDIINTLVDGFEGILLDISTLSARDTAHKNAINRLGHMSLGASYNNVDGNGVTLLAVYNKLNIVINNVNSLIDGATIMGHIGNLPSTSMWTSWNDLP